MAVKSLFSRFEYPERKPLRLKDILEKDSEVDIPQYVLNRINGKYRDNPIVSDPENVILHQHVLLTMQRIKGQD